MRTLLNYTLIVLLFSLGSCSVGNKEKQQLSYTTVTCGSLPVFSDDDWYKSGKKAPLFNNLGDYSFPVSTKNELAQTYFNQGLILTYGFNHAEAARSFYYAATLDPECAMAYWGYAYVLGPNYNAGMESKNYPIAFDAIQKAILLAENATPKERDLIQATARRYSQTVPRNRSELDATYAEAMKTVYETYPDDPDIGTIYSESLMNLHPWDLYEFDGTAKPWTAEIVETLENVISKNPDHPGAHHFYIHAVEASDSPERGLQSAKVYDDGLVSGAGHLVHMPSHIYIRTGDYHKGTLANIRAVQSDSLYTTSCHAQGVYPLTYYPHNYHFLAATATLEGNSFWGILASEKMSDQISIQLMQEPGWGTLQHFYTIPYYVYVKFGKWDKILDHPDEVPSLTYPSAVRAYARGMAFLGKDDITNAHMELEKLEILARDESLKDLTIWDINSTYDLVRIAQNVLTAEILASEKDYNQSIQLLEAAIKIEDGLNYNEPPDWFFSVRHHLGAVQIEAQKYQEAIRTYQEDLKNLPRNGWALQGMKLAYNKLGEADKEAEINQLLAEVWSTADTQISSSRIK
ncbi:tetratricopeptide repeat protein [Maribellus sediminis]|uniref:tetratricopeptide repeat protein n=1 Tax=Maribellus sediminis TaxID=2696285 RepID=UPI001981767C|nr:tetratricopeptide repeat protein [Maribellus sediminis]